MIKKRTIIALIVFVISYASIFLLNLIPTSADSITEPTTTISTQNTTAYTESTTTQNKDLKPTNYSDCKIESVNNIMVYIDNSVSESASNKYINLIDQIEDPFNSKLCFVKINNKPLHTYTQASFDNVCYYNPDNCTMYIFSEIYSAQSFYYEVGLALDRHSAYSSKFEWGILSTQLKQDFPGKDDHELFATAVMLYYTDFDNLAGYKEVYNYISNIIRGDRR